MSDICESVLNLSHTCQLDCQLPKKCKHVTLWDKYEVKFNNEDLLSFCIPKL